MSRPPNVYPIVIATAIVDALAYALNPYADQHRAKIKASVAERTPVVGMLGVASHTTVGDKSVSWGAFGMVFFMHPSLNK